MKNINFYLFPDSLFQTEISSRLLLSSSRSSLRKHTSIFIFSFINILFFKLINIDNSCIPIKKYSLTCRDKSWYPNTCWGWNNKTWQWEQWEKSGIYWLTIADYSRGTANNSGEWQIRDYHPRKHGEIL